MALLKLFILFFIATVVLAKPPQSNKKKAVAFNIPGGKVVGHSKYPFLASLRSNIYTGMTHDCSGAIISAQFVLLAAKCIERGVPHSKYAIAVGAQDQFDGEILEIQAIHVHEEFDLWSLQNDIALVKLTHNIHFSRNVQPIELDSNFIRAGFEAHFTGFGDDKNDGSIASRRVYLTTLTEDECRAAYGMRRSYIHGNKTLCASIDEPDTVLQESDSGGALVLNNRLIGILSWGNRAFGAYPDGFTRISTYIEWIKNTMAK